MPEQFIPTGTGQSPKSGPRNPKVQLLESLQTLAQNFPADLVEAQLNDVERVAFQLNAIVERAGTDISLCDIGSGLGMFPAACAQEGMRVTMLDDFASPFADEAAARANPDAPDAVNFDCTDEALAFHRSLGVRAVVRDPLREGFGFPSESLDVVTCIGSMEHWHQSPKRLFASVMEALVPGGLFLLGVPNCVNLRKRLTVPLGYGKWSQIQHWYEPETFRGHVREPDIDDLRYIARDMKLQGIEILGRNWIGLGSSSPSLRRATRLVDFMLRLRPSLCSDLYLIGRKSS